MVLDAIAWFGVASSVAAIFVFVGLLPLAGGVTDGRLEFTFQYANAAGAWFGACTLLCLLGKDDRLRTLAALPVAAMLLTQSIGVLVAFLAVAIATGLWLAKTGARELLVHVMLQGLLGVILFAVTAALASPVALFALVATMVACLALQRNETHLMSALDTRKATFVLIGLYVFALIGAVALMQTRISTALYSITERWYHVKDGLSLWSSSPLLGVGPNNWQYLFRYIQTAPYDVSVVHSSLVQTLTDAGLVGLAFLAAACALGIRTLAKRYKTDKDDGWVLAELGACVLLLIHSVLEFDLQFGSLAFLLVLLLCGPGMPLLPLRKATHTEETRVTYKNPAFLDVLARGVTAGLASLVVCLPLCVAGLACATTSTMLVRSNAERAYEETVRRFWSNPWTLIDVSAQGEYLAARYGLGDYPGVAETYDHMAAPSDASTLYAALALHSRGMGTEAASMIIGQLEARPYDEAMVNAAKQFSQSVGVDPSMRQEFDAALMRVERRIAESDLMACKQKLEWVMQSE